MLACWQCKFYFRRMKKQLSQREWASAFARSGGRARDKKLSIERKREIAKQAANTRWAAKRKEAQQ